MPASSDAGVSGGTPKRSNSECQVGDMSYAHLHRVNKANVGQLWLQYIAIPWLHHVYIITIYCIIILLYITMNYVVVILSCSKIGYQLQGPSNLPPWRACPNLPTATTTGPWFLANRRDVPRRTTVASLSQNDVWEAVGPCGRPNWKRIRRVSQVENLTTLKTMAKSLCLAIPKKKPSIWWKKYWTWWDLLLGFEILNLLSVYYLQNHHYPRIASNKQKSTSTVQSKVIPKITWAGSRWKWRCNPNERWWGLVVRAVTP